MGISASNKSPKKKTEAMIDQARRSLDEVRAREPLIYNGEVVLSQEQIDEQCMLIEDIIWKLSNRAELSITEN